MWWSSEVIKTQCRSQSLTWGAFEWNDSICTTLSFSDHLGSEFKWFNQVVILCETFCSISQKNARLFSVRRSRRSCYYLSCQTSITNPSMMAQSFLLDASFIHPSVFSRNLMRNFISFQHCDSVSIQRCVLHFDRNGQQPMRRFRIKYLTLIYYTWKHCRRCCLTPYSVLT